MAGGSGASAGGDLSADQSVGCQFSGHFDHWREQVLSFCREFSCWNLQIVRLLVSISQFISHCVEFRIRENIPGIHNAICDVLTGEHHETKNQQRNLVHDSNKHQSMYPCRLKW